MKRTPLAFAAALLLAPFAAYSHKSHADGSPAHSVEESGFTEELRQQILEKYRPKAAPSPVSARTRSADLYAQASKSATSDYVQTVVLPQSQSSVGADSLFSSLFFGSLVLAPALPITPLSFTPPAGNGLLMASSFAPFKPKVRYYWDSTYFYEESDGIPDRTRQPDLMVSITSWQQQVPLPTSYFGSTTNGTNNTGSLGYQQPNYWRIPLVPVPATSPISLTGNFLRGAVALGADGVAIFNPRNNTGQFSQAIGELDAYGGHCGLGDDYHYHIFPTHLTPVLGNDKPIAWALDGYPVYGYVEPDGSAQQALDADGGHNHGTWGYHYHARGTYNAGTSTWTPASPYMMNAMHGTVVNFDSQIDPQPTGSGLRASGTGGYTAQPVAGAVVTAFKNPVALTLSGGHLVENFGGVASDDSWLMRYVVSGTTYDLCWQLNRRVNPRTLTITWRHPTTGTTTTTYNNAGNRITQYSMAGPSIARLPDTGQTLDTTATFGEDADYTRNAPFFTDNANGTITDNNTGLTWQKADNGESTWENAVTNAASVTTGGYTDWRLPTPGELFSIFNHDNGNPALNTIYFPSNSPAAGYWWTSDIYGNSTTNVWCANAGGGLGPKPKSETISAGGTLRYHARYVRGAKPTNGHNYLNNGDGTITDLDTNLMWTQAPGAAVAWDAAISYAEGLTTGGFSDWRLPNVKELQTLTDYARATATASTTTPSLNRTLFPAAAANAYWSSTTLKGGATTEAWVVEFGVNAASTPPRNAQGIISYGLKTENYPVFAVRTVPEATSTQIAVEQPSGAALTDDSGTVAYGSVNVGSNPSKTFVIRNNSTTTALSITSVTIDGANAANFAVTAAPASSIAAGGSTTMIVQFAPNTAGSKTAVLHIASSDSAVGTAFDINLTGTGGTAAPTISNIATTPTVPSNTDAPTISATITPGSGATLTSATLTYNTGAQTTNTIFNETMAPTATAGTGGWDGTGAVYAWTPNSLDGAGNIKQTAGTSNHTPAGGCGVVLGKGSATSTDPTRTMVTLTNAINATGTFTSGSTTTNYIEFWVRTVGLTGTNGWNFQLAPNGTTYTERLSEFTASVHGYQLYHYNLLAADLTSTLKMRFGFVGNGVGGPTGSSVSIDDIVVVTTSGSAPTPVTMTGPASGGTFTATIPAQISGTTIIYSISATDSNAQTTTITNAGSYTTGQAPTITTSATLPNATPNLAYSTALAATGGAGGNVWGIVSGALPSGLTLSDAGVISGTSTAQGTFNFTIKVTDSAGRIATKAFILNVTSVTAPNVVIILTDDQGWADVGYHTAAGQVPIQTPNMDRFGTDGLRLEKFYPTPVCSLTRGCLLTGRNSLRTNVGNQKGLGLPEHLMPQTFKAAGYQTFMCGKWHIGGWDNNLYTTTMNGATIEVQHEGAEYLPHNRGWDFHKGQYGGAINYFTHTTSDPGKNNALDWWQNGVPLPNDNTDLQGNGGYSTDLLADKAVELIQTRDPSKPMLLYLAFNAIHAGVSAPQSYLNKYAALGVASPRRTICAAVDCMDVAMGRVLTALDAAGITNNTLVLYLSDNGGENSSGALNSPLRGTKSDSYDGGLHTPAGIRWPGHLAAGVTSNQYVWVGDIFPTICAAVGVTPLNTKPFDGLNLWPALQSVTAASADGASRGAPLVTGDAGGSVAFNPFTEPVTSAPNQMFKLIRNRVGATITNELFNMTTDPYETTDLLLGVNAASYTTIVNTLTAAITGIVIENYPPYIGPTGLTQTVAAGGTITLYAPFSSYRAPTVQWRRNGANIGNASPFFQVTNSSGVVVNGVYMATYTLINALPSDAGSYDVTVTSTSGTVTSPAGTLTVTATPRQTWWFNHLGTISYSGNAAALADPEGDGIQNLAEWAFGLDPVVNDGSGVTLSGATITKRGGPTLGSNGVTYSAIFGRRKEYVAAGLVYTVQFSADLNTWENGTTTPTTIAADAEIDAVAVPFPSVLSTGARPQFFRVSVTAP